MGGPPGTKTNPLTLMQADPSLYLFIRFQEQAKSDRQFCSFCPMYERGRISWRVATWEERIIQEKKVPYSQASGPPNLWLLFLTP